MTGRRVRLSAADIPGAWAIIPTPARADAADWRATNTVDLDETARATEAFIAAGIDGILSLGTFGEGAACWPTLRRPSAHGRPHPVSHDRRGSFRGRAHRPGGMRSLLEQRRTLRSGRHIMSSRGSIWRASARPAWLGRNLLYSACKPMEVAREYPRA